MVALRGHWRSEFVKRGVERKRKGKSLGASEQIFLLMEGDDEFTTCIYLDLTLGESVMRNKDHLSLLCECKRQLCSS